MLLLEGVALHASSVRALTAARSAAAVRSRAAETALLALHFAAYLSAVFLVLSPVKAVVFILVQQGLFGFYLGCSFAPNHKGMPVLAAGDKVGFLHRQVLTSRNVRGGWLTDDALGGLNHQIEHHLFPSMPRPNLRQARPLIERVLRRARAALRRVQPARLLRPGAALPQPGWPSDPVADHRSSNGGSSVRLVITASGSASG